MARAVAGRRHFGDGRKSGCQGGRGGGGLPAAVPEYISSLPRPSHTSHLPLASPLTIPSVVGAARAVHAHLPPPTSMIGTPTALVAAAIGAAAAATAVPAAAVPPATHAADVGLFPAGKVLTLNNGCDGACQSRVAAALTAWGCTDVAVLPTLRLATAVCEGDAAAARGGGRVEAADAETAELRTPAGCDGGRGGHAGGGGGAGDGGRRRRRRAAAPA